MNWNDWSSTAACAMVSSWAMVSGRCSVVQKIIQTDSACLMWGKGRFGVYIVPRMSNVQTRSSQTFSEGKFYISYSGFAFEVMYKPWRTFATKFLEMQR